MKSFVVPTIAAAALMAIAGSASAKEVTGVKVCGASGCKALADVKAWTAESREPAPETFDAPVGNYYNVEMSFGDGGQTVGNNTSYWLAGPGLMHAWSQTGYDPWWQATDGQNAALRSASATVQPFTPALSHVVVGGKEVADPSSYIRLFGNFPASYRNAPKRAHWITIKVIPAHPNPWLQTAGTLRYQPQLRLLRRPDHQQVVLPKTLGNLLVKRASLAEKGSGDGHEALYAGGSAAGLGAVALLAAVRYRRRIP